jgi:hypothetical protein
MDRDWRSERIVGLEPEAEDPRHGDEGPETLEQLEVKIQRLRALLGRAERRQLEADDWALLIDVIKEEM